MPRRPSPPRPPGAAPRAPSPRGRGFERTGSLLQGRIREVAEGRGGRGLMGAKLAAHWAEIVGPEIAARAHPVKVGYSGKGLGATLTLLTTGPDAPVIEMERERIRERVNAVYGFGAIARVRVTQTAPEGFAEGQAVFAAAAPEPPRPEPPDDGRAREIAAGVEDEGLRAALEALARNVMKRST